MSDPSLRPGRLTYAPQEDSDGFTIGVDHFVIDEAGNQVACPPNGQDARRLAACWNACEGVPLESLEAGAVADLLRALVDLLGLYETPRDAIGGVEAMILRRARAAIAKAGGST